MNQTDDLRDYPSGPTFFKHAQNAAQRWGEREFAMDGTHRISFSQLAETSRGLAAQLRARGLCPGDVAVACVPNWVESIQIYAAVSACGAIFAPCPADTRRPRLAEIIELVHPKVVFAVDREQLDALDDAGFEGTAIGVRLHDDRSVEFDSLLHARMQDDRADGFEPVLETGISTIIFTSGTTGKPKGVMGTAHAHTYNSEQVAKCLSPTTDDVIFVPIAYCHIFGLNNGLLLPLMFGTRLVLTDYYSPTRSLELVNDEGCTVQLGVPTMFMRQLAISQKRGVPFGLHAGIVGGSVIPPGFVQSVEDKTGCRLLPSYGMTEATGGVTLTYYDDAPSLRYGADGCSIDGGSMAILDDAGCELACGEVGEIAIKTPSIMAGYYTGGPFEIQPEIADDWFRTGDLGSLDEAGYLHIAGRKKDVIMRGGISVFPAEVECVFQMLDDIEDACLVGLPDDDLGERCCLAIAFDDATGTPAYDEDALIRHAKAHLERQKVPDSIVVVDAMPRLQSGKIDKRALVDLLSEL